MALFFFLSLSLSLSPYSRLISSSFFFTLMTTKKTIEINDLFVSLLFLLKKCFKTFPHPSLLSSSWFKQTRRRRQSHARGTTDDDDVLQSPLDATSPSSQLSERYFFSSLSLFIWLHYFSSPPFCYFEIQEKRREYAHPVCVHSCSFSSSRCSAAGTLNWLTRPSFLPLLFCSSFAYYYRPLLLKPFNFFDGWEMEKLLLLLLLCTAPVIRLLQPRQ